jgi:hypothetical protein
MVTKVRSSNLPQVLDSGAAPQFVATNLSGTAASLTAGGVPWSGISGIPAIAYSDGGTYNTNISGTAASANALNSGNSYTVTRILAGNGSVGAPSIGFSSDGATDTGFYWGGDGYINFTNNGVYSGQINPSHDLTMAGNVSAYSDARLKTNVKTISDALNKVLQLRGVTFDKDGKASIGVIAQEVREILPELVLEANDEMKTLSVVYGNIVGVLIEAIKELNTKVDDLTKQLGQS